MTDEPEAAAPAPELAPEGQVGSVAAEPAPKPAKAAPAPVEAVPEPIAEPTAMEQAVQAWLQDKIANSPISRDETCWNHLVTALPALIQRLAAL
jgi:hypothetical protein